jgi:hypothetical protein
VPLEVSSLLDRGLVQGARPAVGPDGEIYLVWGAADTTEASRGQDWKRMRRSDDLGRTFGPEATVTGLYSNFGSGAPGYNRGSANDFPGIAVDRSGGPHRGRVYVVWQEGLDIYDDYPAGSGVVVLESERLPPDTAAFAIGDLLRGAIVPDDVDAFRFRGHAGESVIFYVDSVHRNLELEFELLSGDGPTRMTFTAPAGRGRGRAVFVSLPDSGDYVLRLRDRGGREGGYRVLTGFVGYGGERARDHRDVFVTHSDDGRVWSPPVRVNQDPPRYDNWLPEVAVSARGGVYVAWHDWRETPPGLGGSWSQIWLARSDDGGERWTELGALSGAPTAWSDVTANLIPNQGDYIAMFADHRGVEVAWADGRDGDPDVYAARLDLAGEPPPLSRGTVAIASVRPNPASREVTVELALGARADARLEVLDVTGRQVGAVTVPGAGGLQSVRFDLDPALPSGIYYLRVFQGGRASSTRFALVR